MLRSSLAARLLAGGLAFTIVLIAGVSGFLLVSRNQQTETAALSNADNRAGVAAQLLARVTEPQAAYAAAQLAGMPQVRRALAGPAAAAQLAAALGNARAVDLPGLSAVVLDAGGHVVFTTQCDSAAPDGALLRPSPATCDSSGAAHVSGGLPSVRGALAAARSGCTPAASSPVSVCPTVAGTELLGATNPAFDVAQAVPGPGGGAAGVVVYSSPLTTQFQAFGPVIGYTPVFTTAHSRSLLRFATLGAPPQVMRLPAAVNVALRRNPGGAVHAMYALPAGQVAAGFVPMRGPGGGEAGYLGVEVPLSVFAAATAQDERTIGEIALTALVLVSLLVLLFVDRFVRRPVGRLERAVSRIAEGDYTTDVPVTSHDELGRLAQSVNVMRAQIAGYVRHVDAALEQLQDVSRALTTTTGGLRRLQQAVVEAAAATAGAEATASILTRRGDDLFIVDQHGHARERVLDPSTVAWLLDGSSIHIDREGRHLLAVPMFYQGRVTGAIVTVTQTAVFESSQRTLETLANNAAVAIENTRLFEQERETVQRLRELNQMKSDFLATAQHELRTPVLAIQGQLELLTAGWQRWDEESRMDIIRDIEISTRLLGELLEMVVDFSMLSSDTLELKPQAVDVGAAAAAAIADIRGHFKEDLPLELSCAVQEGSRVLADPERFRKVLRALLDNAVKFTPRGGHVVLEARPEFATGTCRIDVIDDGIGISPDALPRIFDRFYQEDNSRTRRHGGIGMGLALVRRLCEAHGATVSAASTPGKGTRLTLVWPLSLDTPAPMQLPRVTVETSAVVRNRS